MKPARPILATLILAALASPARAADFIWWEAESPAKTNFPQKTWMSAENLGDKKSLLSGNQWLTADGKRTGRGDELFATYTINAPSEATYNLWARKFWQHGPFTWHFDDQPPQTCGKDIALADSVDIQKFLCVNWVYLGKVKLAKGPHTFEIRLLAKPGENTTAAFDCFCLTPGPFLPNGKLKPGERSGAAEPGWFAWEPALDPFTNDALLDLRNLNEKNAGDHGFLKRAGAAFLLGTQPTRFFAVNLSPANAAGSRESVDYLADALAKRGVNMIRCHGGIYDFSQGPGTIDPKKLDDIQYLIAAMKKRGIYTTLSLYFPLWMDAEKDLKFTDYANIKNKYPFALLEFDPKFQEIYRAWARTILTTKNPYSETPLAEDPALAIVEIQNEDSFFFWTFTRENIPPAAWRELEQQFAAWCIKHHGSLEKTLAAWGNAKTKNDDPANNRLELFPAWNMTADGAKNSPGGPKRIGDQVRFLAETQRNFYADTAKFLKSDLKLGGLVEASNWTVSDPKTLDAVERYTYTATDVIDRHGYFSGQHEGPTAGYSVSAGDSYEDKSALLAPEAMPFNVHAVEGFPHIITELGFTQPNRFRAESNLLSAAYASLQGTNGLYFFAVGSNFLRDAGINKFQVCDPVISGTFPAAALLYRRGDVETGPYAVTEAITGESLFSMKGTATAAAQALDEFRAVAGAPPSKATFDPLLFYVGRVERTLEVPPLTLPPTTRPVAVDTARFIDHKNKTVRSATGQLAWNYGEGLLTVNTPRAQAAAGFLAKAGKIDLADITIDCANEYASITVIALDELPLKTSKRILIQAMTEDKPFGFKSISGKIIDLGSGPFNVKKIDARVTFKSEGNFTPNILDENGYLTPRSALSAKETGASKLILPPDAIYTILTR